MSNPEKQKTRNLQKSARNLRKQKGWDLPPLPRKNRPWLAFLVSLLGLVTLVLMAKFISRL